MMSRSDAASGAVILRVAMASSVTEDDANEWRGEYEGRRSATRGTTNGVVAVADRLSCVP